ncbi:hypothetical protein [Mycobacterium sp. TY815]|uniref:hypothetical protein n=1 Tax=Mycobacterium sp. TY815 TaxID=3050581 RepID=UPI002742023E|nr:hypothetical protein [Mycobacterium sp. TY815]MDP7707476.1 hypothetical protein [Mycobacterium sp. TY815]
MIETIVSAADLVDAIPSLWESIKKPGAILLIMVGLGGAIMGLGRGFGTAAGKLLGGIALAAITLGAVGLMGSLDATVNRHGGGILTGQYGN